TTVAVARWITFIAMALQSYPESRDRLIAGEDHPQWFVQEVRRLYPFFPAMAARVRDTFDWNGYEFPEGTRVLLDLYGINRDERLWERPEEFRPERFRDWDGDPFRFVP